MSRKPLVADEVWKLRINAANRLYDKWEGLMDCKVLEDYYEGNQWKSMGDYRPYTINKVFETIEIKISQFIPVNPKFLVAPRPGSSDFELEAAALSSTMKQDVLNTLIQNPNINFSDEMEAAYKDSFFRFGIIEVDYDADWISNPNAHKPVTGKSISSEETKEGRIVQQPEELPVNERIYFKHIPAKTFRVGGVDSKYLNRCGWVGYYEWVYRDDLLSLKSIRNKEKIETAQINGLLTHEFDGNESSIHKDGVVKVWKIWDLRTRKRLLILDSPCVTLFERSFTRLPLFDYRPNKRVKELGFYPIPPVKHWLSPQDEYNEVREMYRTHRRRFIRKYGALEGAVTEEEIEKFETGSDGAVIKMTRENAIFPIANAPLGPEIDKTTGLASDDLNKISGTSSEVRGAADRTTATQANIIDRRSTMRESSDRSKIFKWLEKMGREALLIASEKFTLGIWAELTADTQEGFLGEVQENSATYQFVSSEELNDGYDFHITVDVTTMSEDTQEEEKRHFLEFLSVTTQFPQIAFSPILIREAAYRVGYRNERIIREMQKMALLATLGQAVQNGGGPFPEGQGQGNSTSQQIVANNTPPDGEEIRNQLTNQLGIM